MPQRSRPPGALLALLAAGCIPSSAMPPPVAGPVDSRGGLGGSLGAEQAWAPECTFQRLDDGAWDDVCEGFVESLDAIWSVYAFRQPRGGAWQVGGALARGRNSPDGQMIPAGSVFLRGYPVRGDGLRLGVHTELGMGTAGLGLPVAVALRDRVWLHTLPRVVAGLDDVGEVHVPLGTTLEFGDNKQLTVEVAAATWDGFETTPMLRGLVALTVYPKPDPEP